MPDRDYVKTISRTIGDVVVKCEVYHNGEPGGFYNYMKIKTFSQSGECEFLFNQKIQTFQKVLDELVTEYDKLSRIEKISADADKRIIGNTRWIEDNDENLASKESAHRVF